MSQENVEIVRAAYEAWNATGMEALRELYDPDAVMVRGLEVGPNHFLLSSVARRLSE